MIAIWIIALAAAVWAYDRRATRRRERGLEYALSVQELEHDTKIFVPDDGVVLDIPRYLQVLNHSSICAMCADLREKVDEVPLPRRA